MEVFWDEKVSREVFSMIDENRSLSPKYIITIEWRTFYLSDPHSSGRDTIIWYTKDDNWFLQARLFYFSVSWWNRHCSPWFDAGGGRYSKWEFVPNMSYEKWTIVWDWLQNSLEQINSTVNPINWVDVDWIYTDTYWSINHSAYTRGNPNTLPSKQFANEISVCSDLVANWKNKFESFFSQWSSLESIDRKFSSIDISNFDFTNAKITEWSYSKHAVMWDVKSYVMTCNYRSNDSKFNWRPVEIIVQHSTTEPWLLRVENLQFSDSKTTSFWNTSDQLSWWVLTAKPWEYKQRLPSSITFDSSVSEYKPYKDIRWFMQKNPLLQIFRSRKWLNHANNKVELKQPEVIPVEKAFVIINSTEINLWWEFVKVEITNNQIQVLGKANWVKRYISPSDGWVTIGRWWENPFGFWSRVSRDHWAICMYEWRIRYKDLGSLNWSIWHILP